MEIANANIVYNKLFFQVKITIERTTKFSTVWQLCIFNFRSVLNFWSFLECNAIDGK